MRADEVGTRRELIAGSKDDLNDHPKRGADDEGRQTKYDGELRDVETTEAFRHAPRYREPPPVEDDEKLDRSEDRPRLEVPGPEREHIRRGRDRTQHHAPCERRSGAAEDPDRETDHAHRDPPERARVEVRQQRVAIKRSEELRRVRQAEKRRKREDEESVLECASGRRWIAHKPQNLPLRGARLARPRVQRDDLHVLWE